MDKLNQLYETIKCIYELLEKWDEKALYAKKPEALPARLLSATEVMDKLNISRATYYRYIQNGELVPRKKGTRHYYYESDLVEALAESRRRGRI